MFPAYHTKRCPTTLAASVQAWTAVVVWQRYQKPIGRMASWLSMGEANWCNGLTVSGPMVGCPMERSPLVNGLIVRWLSHFGRTCARICAFLHAQSARFLMDPAGVCQDSALQESSMLAVFHGPTTASTIWSSIELAALKNQGDPRGTYS